MKTTTIENPGDSPIMNWLRDHIDYPHKDYCLIWPFTRTFGYGGFVRNGSRIPAHRYICELKNGPPPSDIHQAAHSCHRGTDGCVNPHHLRWKTPSENMLEAPSRPKLKLCLDQAMEIRSLKGLEPNAATADRFGVTECTIRDIQDGRTWSYKRRLSKGFRDREIQSIRSMKGIKSAKELAAQYDVSANAIYKIWLRITWAHVPDADSALSSV